VLLLPGGEDGLADTVMPRLTAAGADLNRVFAWHEAVRPTFPQACPRMEALIQQTRARLVLCDPFFSFLGRDTGSLNDLMIRRALGPLAEVAEATQAAFLLVRHLGKGSIGKAACYRGLGSMAILGAVRTAFLIARDPDDPLRRVLACTKNNLAVFPPSLGFRIVGVPGGVAPHRVARPCGTDRRPAGGRGPPPRRSGGPGARFPAGASAGGLGGASGPGETGRQPGDFISHPGAGQGGTGRGIRAATAGATKCVVLGATGLERVGAASCSR
jgi:hypothetical protein